MVRQTSISREALQYLMLQPWLGMVCDGFSLWKRNMAIGMEVVIRRSPKNIAFSIAMFYDIAQMLHGAGIFRNIYPIKESQSCR